ncbi:MAG: hypothetical protein K2M68_01305 [Muribaculaceae bacterium]|nr:hypothetical protein [Muribaculaceae bacterium]
MKRYITAAVSAFITIYSISAATTESTDTIRIVGDASKVVISETDKGIAVNVDNNNTIYIADYNQTDRFSTSQSTTKHLSFFDYQAYTFSKSQHSKSHWDAISGGFNIGLVNAVGQPADLGMRWSKSFEISWLNTLGVRYTYRSLSVSLGLGLDWRNYKITGNDHYMVSPAPGEIDFVEAPDGARSLSSRIKVFSLGLPLLYTQRIPGTTLAFTAGAILNFNTHASLRSTYESADNRHIEEYSEGIGKRNVTYDLYGAITFYRGNGLYIRYSPQSVLKGSKVPQFHPLSIGVTLFM